MGHKCILWFRNYTFTFFLGGSARKPLGTTGQSLYGQPSPADLEPRVSTSYLEVTGDGPISNW